MQQNVDYDKNNVLYELVYKDVCNILRDYKFLNCVGYRYSILIGCMLGEIK